MRAIASVAVVALVVLAGCIGGLGAVDSTGASTPDYAPGVADDGITDPTELLAAHEEILAGIGYELTFALEYESGDDTMRQSKQVDVGTDGKFSVDEQSTYGDQTVTRALFSDGTVAYERDDFTGETTYSGYDAAIAYGELTGSEILETFLSAVSYEASETQRDGQTVTLLQADSVSADPFGFGEETTVTSTIVVDAEGLVQSLDATVTNTAGEEAKSVTVTYAVTPAAPTVTEPNWVSENRDEMTIADLEYAIKGDAVKITHAGGDTLPEGTEVTLVVQQSEGEVIVTYATLNADLGPGETASVHNVGSEEPATAYVGSHQDPDGGTVIDGIVEVTVRDGMSLVDLSYLSSDDE
ncbi:hypothetical protein [Haloarchaeobius sp. HME9146]|uniref:hypothetical protein n=1 Tax=Haloarchaeobius sp. HME9146 TaxID=2978732 RepID=UPI0021C0FCE7|nr:hypothetical protein [Haloarchaeobius sp. HME9146]MCT9095753.1 hypothetical protein [Haloarchaeobius sp. HME9146]